jgi:hypothetical protein
MEIRVECVHDDMVPIGDLKPHPQNPNTHSETQIATLADLITSIGWRFPIVVSKRSGYIIAGHARLAAGLRLGWEMVPVDYQDFASETDEITQLLADNKIPELASRDPLVERGLLHQLLDANASTVLAGYMPAEVEKLLKAAEKKNEGAVLGEHEIPAMELQPHEHYDYLVLLFRHDYDWIHALQALGVQDVNYSSIPGKKKIGLGRVMDGTRVLSQLLHAQGDSEPGPVGDDHVAPTAADGDAGGDGPGAAPV